jgi:hypothetical protein
VSGKAFHLQIRPTLSGYGPAFYMERGGFMLHVGCRYFTLPWQHGLGAWLTLRVRGRYLIFRSGGCL